MTLVGDIELELNDVIKLADTFLDYSDPADATVCDIGVSENYFMALYLSVSISDELQYRRKIATQRLNRSNFNLDAPHVSLAYGNLDQSQMLEEQTTLKSEFLGERLSVGGISIVRSAKTVPVGKWHSIETIALSSANRRAFGKMRLPLAP